jgi:hypothetical protein
MGAEEEALVAIFPQELLGEENRRATQLSRVRASAEDKSPTRR